MSSGEDKDLINKANIHTTESIDLDKPCILTQLSSNVAKAKSTDSNYQAIIFDSEVLLNQLSMTNLATVFRFILIKRHLVWPKPKQLLHRRT